MRILITIVITAIVAFSLSGNAGIPELRPENLEGISGMYVDMGGSPTGIVLQLNEPPALDTVVWITFDENGNQVWLLGVLTIDDYGFEQDGEPRLFFDKVYWVKNGVPMSADFDLEGVELLDIGDIQIIPSPYSCNELALQWVQTAFEMGVPVIPNVVPDYRGWAGWPGPWGYLKPNMTRLTRIKNSQCP